MGRGDQNILFGSPLFKKSERKEKEVQMGKGGTFPSGAAELFLIPGASLLRGKRNDLYYLNKNFDQEKNFLLTEKLSSECDISVTGRRVALGDDDGFVVQNLSQANQKVVYKESLPGPLSGIYLGGDSIYAAVWDEEIATTRLYEGSALHSEGWREMPGYGEGESFILQKGDLGLLFYQQTERGTSAFATLSPDGPGRVIYLPKSFNTHSDPQSLLAAFDNDECVGVVENEYGEPEIRHFSLESFAATGPAIDRRIASLTEDKGISSLFFKSMAASEQRFALLCSRELIIGNKEGIQDIIPIDAEQRYDRISFHGERAVIWQTHYDAYQEFSLPRKT